MFTYKPLRTVSTERSWQPWECRECGSTIKRESIGRMDVRERCPCCQKETTFRRADLEKEEPEIQNMEKRRLNEIADRLRNTDCKQHKRVDRGKIRLWLAV